MRRHAHHVGGQARGDELVDRFARRHQHLAAHVAALLHRGELVLEVHAGGAGLDHRLHQLEGVQHAAEAGFGIGHDRREVVDVVLAFGTTGSGRRAAKRVVDALDHRRHRVDRVQRLVRIHLAGDVGVAGDLPAGQVDRLQAGLDLLHRLVAGQRAERVDERLVVAARFHSFSAPRRASVCSIVQRAAQAHDVVGAVAALDALPARVLGPVLFECGDLLFAGEVGPVAHVITPVVDVETGGGASGAALEMTLSLVEDFVGSYVL